MCTTTPGFIDWGCGLTNFCPSWPQTTIISISTSRVVRIIGMHHHQIFSFSTNGNFILQVRNLKDILFPDHTPNPLVTSVGLTQYIPNLTTSHLHCCCHLSLWYGSSLSVSLLPPFSLALYFHPSNQKVLIKK